MGKLVSLVAAGAFQPPQPLTGDHDVSAFECGEPDLDAWLKRHAVKNQARGSSRTFAVTQGNAVVGFYCLAVGTVAHTEAIPSLRRNMPDPIPVMVLGRLAVQNTYAGLGIGSGLLKDAILRTLQVSEMAGIAALLVHAKHTKAAEFYLKHGFKPSGVRELTLMLPVRAMAAWAA